MIYIIIFLLSLIGFVLLLLAMMRHQQDWFRRKLPAATSQLLRLLGFVALALALCVSGNRLGWGNGMVNWLGWLTIAGALIVGANVNRERIMRAMKGCGI